MKLRFLAPLFAFTLLLNAPAQDEAPQIEEKSAEQHEKEDADSEKTDMETTVKMMKVFKPLEGEWTGKEKVEYNHELPMLKNKPDVEWDDTFRGFFTRGGRYFEMEGETSGKLSSNYRWVVTYDSNDEIYKAWSFGSTGFSEYQGELTTDGKSVLWTHTNELDWADVEDTFQFHVDGNSCKASGETVLKAKDGSNSKNYSTHTSRYTRKKVDI